MGLREDLERVELSEADVIEWRDARFSISQEDGARYNGYLLMTKTELIFVKSKGFLSKPRIMYRVPIAKVQTIKKYPFVGYTIFANVAENDAGVLKKMFSSKNAVVRMDRGAEFVEKVREINPNIKT